MLGLFMLLFTASAVVRAAGEEAPGAGRCDDIQAISQAQRTVWQDNRPVADTNVPLPDHLKPAWRNEGTRLRYRLDLRACRHEANAALWLARVGGPYRLLVDGRPLLPILPVLSAPWTESEAVATVVLNGRAPSLFSLPPGSEVAEVEVLTLPYLSAGIALAELGPAPALVPRHVAAAALLPGINNLVAVVVLVVGTMVLALWRLRHQDQQLMWFGLCCLAWGVRGSFYANTPLPLPPLVFEQMVPLLTMVASLALAATTLAWMQALSLRWRLLGIGLLSAGLACFAVTLLLGRGALLARGLGFGTGMLLMPWLIWRLWDARQRLGLWRAILLISGYVLAFASAVLDMGMVLGYRDPAGMSWLLPGFAGLLICTAVLLAEYLLRQLNRAERSNEELERRIAEKSRTLELGFAERREHERDAARSFERERLMREMHDGLGGQLMTVMRGVERGAMPRELVLQALQESLDDLRLLMDTTGGEAVLSESLAAWRSRWQPRLSSLGMALDWEVDEALDGMVLAPGVALHLMRIVQEATVNVIKHARASQLSLWAGFETSGQVLVRVSDNGVGLSAAPRRPGARGLANMASRARQIGATLQCSPGDDGQGTCVSVRLSARPSGGDSQGADTQGTAAATAVQTPRFS